VIVVDNGHIKSTSSIRFKASKVCPNKFELCLKCVACVMNHAFCVVLCTRGAMCTHMRLPPIVDAKFASSPPGDSKRNLQPHGRMRRQAKGYSLASAALWDLRRTAPSMALSIAVPLSLQARE